MNNMTTCGTTPEHAGSASDEASVSLRRWPYPYRAGLAICSDIDATQTTDEFLEIQRFLNTTAMTSMGEGLGLEIGNSFYFYDNKGEWAYFTHDEYAKRVTINLIRTGYIDCLHSYGDGATSRDEILRALDVLHRADCHLDVWINHFGAQSNMSRKFEYMFGECRGDDARSPVYHADVTLDYGIRFAWVGATTRVVGQAPSPESSSWSTVFDPRYPLRSSLSVCKEIRKHVLGKWGDKRYIMQWRNQLMRPLQLEDGQNIHEFRRHCNHPVNIDQGATSRGLSYVISGRALEHLKATQGYMIVYTHLGKNSDCEQVIAPETQAALRHLAQAYRDGQIYVTTTSKLLHYYLVHQYLVWSHQQSEGWVRIHIDYLDDPVFGKITPTLAQLQGLTFYVPDRERVAVYVGGVEAKGMQRNLADDSGRESVTLPFTALSFPY